MFACSASGARSEVPEILLPTVPLKFSMLKATPYSVTEVPRMGISVVAEAQACSAGVAFAIIRSTFLETKLFAIVAQAGMSLEAFCSSKVTLSPRASVKASRKPLVASSNAGC